MKRSILIYFSLMFILFSCEKSSNGDGQLVIPDVNGYWMVTETITGNCEGEDYPQVEKVIFNIEQQDSILTFTTFPEGDVLQGKITGHNITMQGEFSSSYGANAIDFTGTVGGNGTTMNGTADWLWSYGDHSCGGTATITGEKESEVTSDYSGVWTGTWISEEYDNTEGTFTVNVIQSGNVLSGSISVPEIQLLNADLEGEIHGHIVCFGDVDGVIKFAGSINNNTSSGNYIYPYFEDEGSWTAVKSIN
jgi:hypothetical protein